MGKKLESVLVNPIIYRMGKLNNKSIIKIRKSFGKVEILDLFNDQLEELQEINRPGKQTPKQSIKSKTNINKGAWVFLPWISKLVHILNENDYYLVRTNRNRDLLDVGEQKRIRSFNVGIVGLSIGSHIALSLAHLGIGSFRISDFDRLSTSNLNRVPFGLPELTQSKSTLTAQKIFEIDPFLNLEVFGQLTGKNLDKFLAGKKKLDVVIDAMDDFKMKVLLRKSAKKHKIPVLMFTNLGDGCLIDIERYDKESKLQIFNGLLGSIPNRILESNISNQDEQKLAAKLVGIENVPTRALESLPRIGKTLVGRPQLGSTVTVSSGFASYLVKKLALGQDFPSQRRLIHFDTTIFSKEDTSKVYLKEPRREKIISKLTN